MKTLKGYCRLALAGIVMLLVGCVSTRMTSMIDPMHNGKKFGTILVMSLHERSDVAEGFEHAMVGKLRNTGVKAHPNRRVLPPIREYTVDEKREQYQRYGIDAILIITPQGASTATVTIPTYSETRAAAKGTQYTASGRSQTVTVDGGVRKVVTAISTQAQLINLDNGAPVWQGDAETEIGRYAEMDDIAASFCSRTAEILDGYGLLNIPETK